MFLSLFYLPLTSRFVCLFSFRVSFFVSFFVTFFISVFRFVCGVVLFRFVSDRFALPRSVSFRCLLRFVQFISGSVSMPLIGSTGDWSTMTSPVDASDWSIMTFHFRCLWFDRPGTGFIVTSSSRASKDSWRQPRQSWRAWLPCDPPPPPTPATNTSSLSQVDLSIYPVFFLHKSAFTLSCSYVFVTFF